MNAGKPVLPDLIQFSTLVLLRRGFFVRARAESALKRADTRTLQAYLGHKNIQHTVRYTELTATRFKNLGR